MHFFEILMLVCFGLAWPFSIWRTWRSRKNHGKSLLFLIIVLIGYISGVIHKRLHMPQDPVVFLYMLNGLMVSIDIGFYIRNMRLAAPAAVTAVDDVPTE